MNAGYHSAQFWDGRAAGLVEQAKKPILSPLETGMPDEARVVRKTGGLEGYGDAFAAAFLKALTDRNREQYLR